MEDWVTIRNLQKRGKSIKKIARDLSISRNTVRSALRKESGHNYKREEKINEDLMPYEGYIKEKILVNKLRGSRVLKDMRSKGYGGSKSAFYRYLTKIGKTNIQSFKPYETAPGEQAQFDWSPYTLTIGRELTKIFIYTYLLGFSRYRVYSASLSENQQSVFEAMEDGIHQSGGVVQRVQTDNARVFVNDPSRRNVKWNKHYLALCGHYGFQHSRSLPRHPWSKGKVENPFDYLEDHFIKDRIYDSFQDLVDKLKVFEQEVNNKVHSTTKQKPIDLLSKDQLSMSELPNTRFVGFAETMRKVTSDCLISFQGNKYSVPHHFVGKHVWVRVSKGCTVQVYSPSGKLIATHQLGLSKGTTVMRDEHYKNHHVERGNWERLVASFLQIFPDYQWFTDNLKAQKRINPRYHLTQIIELTDYYEHGSLCKAFDQARSYNCYHHGVITALVNSSPSTDNKQTKNSLSKVKPLHNIPDENISRDISQYNNILKQDQ